MKIVPNLVWFSSATTHDHQYLKKLSCDANSNLLRINRQLINFCHTKETETKPGFFKLGKHLSNTLIQLH
ncbi:MAG: hypothetical protein RL060_686 [Bacteroidota bacterium]